MCRSPWCHCQPQSWSGTTSRLTANARVMLLDAAFRPSEKLRPVCAMSSSVCGLPAYGQYAPAYCISPKSHAAPAPECGVFRPFTALAIQARAFDRMHVEPAQCIWGQLQSFCDCQSNSRRSPFFCTCPPAPPSNRRT